MSAPLVLRTLVLAGLACACAATKSTREPRLDTAPFVEMAKNSTCATIRRQLYLIDDAYVFFDRAGNCPDNGYSQTLYGRRVDEVLCTSHDSIAGPVTRCADEKRREMFETILEHVEDTKLGLGPEHDVQRIPL
jgi:hypothetical protein